VGGRSNRKWRHYSTAGRQLLKTAPRDSMRPIKRQHTFQAIAPFGIRGDSAR
jgi:hypothetical protein